MESFEKVYNDYEAIFAADNEDTLIKIFESSKSDLVRHDVCYHLGRLKSITQRGIDFLIGVAVSKDAPVVRHEAIEALSFHEARFGLKDLKTSHKIVEDTLILALSRNNQNTDKLDVCPFEDSESWTMDSAVDKLLSGDIIAQYHAMSFLIKLHKISPENRVQIISAFEAALKLDENYLLKHEICFQLGVLGDSLAWPVLTDLIDRRDQEAPVVVHEALIALEPCSIENKKESLLIVEDLLNHPDPIVSQSAFVAKRWLLET